MISKNIMLEERSGVQIVHLEGSADYNVTTALEFQLDLLQKKKPACTILDISQCNYMGSVGIGILTNYCSNAKKTGRVFIVVSKGAVRDMLSNFRVLTLFEEAQSVDAAIAACVK